MYIWKGVLFVNEFECVQNISTFRITVNDGSKIIMFSQLFSSKTSKMLNFSRSDTRTGIILHSDDNCFNVTSLNLDFFAFVSDDCCGC